jgi:hypothetical protein
MNKNQKANNGFLTIVGILIILIVIGIAVASVWAFVNHAKISSNSNSYIKADNI